MGEENKIVLIGKRVAVAAARRVGLKNDREQHLGNKFRVPFSGVASIKAVPPERPVPAGELFPIPMRVLRLLRGGLERFHQSSLGPDVLDLMNPDERLPKEDAESLEESVNPYINTHSTSSWINRSISSMIAFGLGFFHGFSSTLPSSMASMASPSLSISRTASTSPSEASVSLMPTW